ncbi:NAD(P)H-dependent oxidoreductase [Thalassobacillus sp. CUG 92003]|uniref:NAD(P)H-dependent oxidoreductase n=1 Tax=Thalassobacillus sp. CUG 92003 TaxID=2736641 RepID=UPI0015E6E603|nr:NAD(P)H-dependent oxidoreductase [Thalassobacillus sp. CUG 92003]
MNGVLLNCSTSKSSDSSAEEKWLTVSARIFHSEQVDLHRFHLSDYDLTSDYTNEREGWGYIFGKIKAADMIIFATSADEGKINSVASQLVKRLHTHQNTPNQKGQSLFYNKIGGVIASGNNENESCSASQSFLYHISLLGFTIPPHANVCGEKLSSQAHESQNHYTTASQQIERMTYNVIHFAEILKFHPIPVIGNTLKK